MERCRTAKMEVAVYGRYRVPSTSDKMRGVEVLIGQERCTFVKFRRMSTPHISVDPCIRRACPAEEEVINPKEDGGNSQDHEGPLSPPWQRMVRFTPSKRTLCTSVRCSGSPVHCVNKKISCNRPDSLIEIEPPMLAPRESILENASQPRAPS